MPWAVPGNITNPGRQNSLYRKVRGFQRFGETRLFCGGNGMPKPIGGWNGKKNWDEKELSFLPGGLGACAWFFCGRGHTNGVGLSDWVLGYSYPVNELAARRLLYQIYSFTVFSACAAAAGESAVVRLTGRFPGGSITYNTGWRGGNKTNWDGLRGRSASTV